MGTASRRRPASLSPPSVADLSTAVHEHRHYACSPDDEDDDADDFEFTPLLSGRRHGSVTHCPRTACRGGTAQDAPTQPPPQRAARRPPHQTAAEKARRVRWHDMAFGSVRVPAAMDMGQIRRRLQAPRRTDEPPVGWAPWRLIRSLSCKGVEAVAVAAASAPVRLV